METQSPYSGRSVMTGLKFVLDTNIVIGLLKGATEADGLRKSLGIELGNSAVSQITRIELLSYPRLSINEEQSIRAFLDACEMLSLSARVRTKQSQFAGQRD